MLTVVRQPGSPGGSLRAYVLLALACCIRPNAVVFVLPLLALSRSDRLRALVCFGATGAGISIVALWAAHALYPDYTWRSFHAALSVYYDVYVTRGAGVAYGSSAYGLFRQLAGYRPGLDKLALLPAALIVLVTIMLARHRPLRASSLLFLTGAAYTLGSTIFGDYHLLPFLLPLMMLAREDEGGGLDERARAIMICSCLMLAPKNLAFPDEAPWQIVANPLILIAGSLQVLGQEWHASYGSAHGMMRLPWPRRPRSRESC